MLRETASQRDRRQTLAVVVATPALTAAMVYGLVYGSLSGHPAITEPWEETKAMAGGILAAAALVFCYGAVALRGLQAPRSRSWWREAGWCAWVAAPPAWLTWTSCRPGGLVRVTLYDYRDLLLAPLPVAAPATLAFVLCVLTLASRSAHGVAPAPEEPVADEPAVSP